MKIHIETLENNCTVSEFSKKFGITRTQAYNLIHQNLLSGIIISGTFYPDFSDAKYIKSLLRHDKQGEWSRSRTYKPVIMKCSEQDQEFERAWKESMGIVD
jgi:hypothetical protein